MPIMEWDRTFCKVSEAPTDLSKGGGQSGEPSSVRCDGSGLGNGKEGPLRGALEHAADCDGSHTSDLYREKTGKKAYHAVVLKRWTG